MRALILRNDSNDAVANSRALINKGFQILCVDTREVAETLVRVDTIDLLVMDEQIDGQLTHNIALSGERKNPLISSIMMTERAGAETDDLYDLIPNLYALVGEKTTSALVGQLALASVANCEERQARIAINQAFDAAEAAEPDEMSDDIDQDDATGIDDTDVPTYADVMFATPALAELRGESMFSDLDDEDEDDDATVYGPDLAANFFARSPLILTHAIPA